MASLPLSKDHTSAASASSASATSPTSSSHDQNSPTSSVSRPTSSHLHTPCSPLLLARGTKRRGSLLRAELPNVSDPQSAEQNVAPFLAKHHRRAFNPSSGGTISSSSSSSTANMTSTYCNRHRPELKCWRQANEPTMEELQTSLSRLDKDDQMGISHVWSVFSAAPSKQRQLMLQGILAVCCFPQLSYVSAQVRELIKIDFIATLPTELSFKILSYLDTVSLCKAAQVSRSWNVLAEDDVVWHKMCEQHIAKKCKKCGWGLPLLDRHRLKADKPFIERRALGILADTPSVSRASSEAPSECPMPETHKRPLDDADEPEPKRACVSPISSPIKRPWKEIYKDRFKVGTNWKYGRHSLKVLKGHENGVMCLQFQDNILASGSYDGTIKLWDLDAGKEIRTLIGHTSGIRCLQFSKCQLFSGGMDKTIRIWNWQTGDLLRTLTGPHGDVLSLDFKAPYLVAGSKDNTVRVWNIQTKGVCALRGHKDFVNSVRLDLESRTVFSGADDNTVCLWDLDSGKVIKTFEGHVGGVQQIALLPPEFELDASDLVDCEHPSSDSEQEKDDLVDQDQIISTECLAVPVIATSFPPASPAPETSLPNVSLFPNTSRPNPPLYMLTASLDSTIRLWHVPTGRCLRTFFGHIEGIWAIAADNLRVVSGSEDKTIKLWDPRSGKCERTFTGHAGPVTCVGLSGDRLITGSEDCEIRVMEFGPEYKPRSKA